ncbi:MAG: hypothetical protein KF781_07530 [Chitinophagaceae bacterium]|nr:hypothetical protein [Chitinophagaceae bacterium]MCW5905604.1 hypothetical protein [Chitinophagaceae bacterium]
MNLKTLYNIVSLLLLPFGLLMLFTTLPMILAAFISPSALFPLFMLICILIYIVCSFIFLQKGIKNEIPCKKTLKDWIKVNAFVSITFAVLMLMQSIIIIRNPSIISEQLITDLAAQRGGFTTQFPPELMHKLLKFISYFMLIYSIIIGLHIVLTFKLIKLYQHIFSKD